MIQGVINAWVLLSTPTTPQVRGYLRSVDYQEKCWVVLPLYAHVQGKESCSSYLAWQVLQTPELELPPTLLRKRPSITLSN
jgi:hypothetical protein